MISFTPPAFVFPSARSAISIPAATAFQTTINSGSYGLWDNITKQLTPDQGACYSNCVGKSLHLWHTITYNQDFDYVESCIPHDGHHIFHLPNIDLPSSGNYRRTVGDAIPLNLHKLVNKLTTSYPTAAFTIRFGRAWSSLTPAQLNFPPLSIHFTNEIP